MDPDLLSSDDPIGECTIELGPQLREKKCLGPVWHPLVTYIDEQGRPSTAATVAGGRGSKCRVGDLHLKVEWVREKASGHAYLRLLPPDLLSQILPVYMLICVLLLLLLLLTAVAALKHGPANNLE
jgi:hypothetical protein